MKKSLAGIVIVLMLVLTSCYINNYDKILVTFSDEGVYLEDPSMHIVKMSVPSGYYDIYYTIDGTTVTASSILYDPKPYYNIDFKIVSGVLLHEGAFVKAVGAKYTSDKDKLTFEGDFEVKKSDKSLNAAPEIVRRGIYSTTDNTAIAEIFADDSSFEIYYTADGTLPVTNGLSYSTNVKTVYNESGVEVTGVIVPMDTEIKAVTKDTEGNFSYVTNFVIYSTSSPVVEDLGPDSSGTGRIYSIKSYDGRGTIYYTTDNSNPVYFGEIYSPTFYEDAEGNTVSGIKLSEGKTLSVVIKRSYGDTYRYSMVLGFPVGDLSSWAPHFVYMGSSALDDEYEVVSLISRDNDAVIYYTLDGSDPIDNGIRYKPGSIECNSIETSKEETVSGISIKRGATIKAVAVKGTTYSNMINQKVEGRLALTPKLTDYGYIRDGYMLVSLSSPDGQGTIYCTTNSSDPKKQSTSYSEYTYTTKDGKTVKGKEISVGTTLRAVVKYGDDYSAELVQKVLNPSHYKPDIVNNWQAADYPGYQIMSMSLPSSVDISNAQFYYTTDESDPKTDGRLYSPEKYKDNLGNEKDGVLVKAGSKINAVTKNGFMYSDISSAEAYDTASWTPEVFNYGTCGDKQIIKMSADEGVKIYYTTDNSSPSGAKKQLYTGEAEYENVSGRKHTGILLSSNTSYPLKVIGEKDGVYSEEYHVYIETTSSMKPEITWSSYSDTKAVVNLYFNREDVEFYYSTDSSVDPAVNGAKYEPEEYKNTKGNTIKGVLVDFDKTMYIVLKKGSLYSDEVVQNIYEKTSWAPEIVNEGGFSSSYQIVSLISSAEGAEIYYSGNINSLKNISNKYSGTQYSLRSGVIVNGIKYSGDYIYAVAKIGDKVSDITELYIEDTYSWAPDISGKGRNKNNSNEEVVVITKSNSDTTVLYTTNGDDPRINGREYEGSTYTAFSGTSYNNAIAVPYGANGTKVKCVARKGDKDRGYTYSDVIALDVYEKSSWAPKLTNNGSNSNGYQIISMETTDPGAQIYYYSSSYVSSSNYSYSSNKCRYTLRSGESVEGITYSSGNTVYAVAYKDGRYSDVTRFYVDNTYNFAPVISLEGKNANNSNEMVVVLTTSSSDGVIFYTTDGGDPRSGGAIVYDGSTYTVSGDLYYIFNDAIAVEYGRTLKCVTRKGTSAHYVYSDVISMDILEPGSYVPVLVNKGSTPDGCQVIQMSSSRSDADIYYTTSSSSSPKNGTRYGASKGTYTLRSGEQVEGVKVYSGNTVRALSNIGTQYSDTASLYVENTYSWTPVFQYLGTKSDDSSKAVIKISTNSTNSTILYTTDGSDPRIYGNEYVGGIYSYSVSGSNYTNNNAGAFEYGKTIKCVARKSGGNGEYIYSDISNYFLSASNVRVENVNGYYCWVDNGTVSGYSGYKCYKSTNNGVDNSYSVMKIYFRGVTSFTIYIRSDAESKYDYTIASSIDASNIPTSDGYNSTMSNQGSYITVTYSGLTTSDHYIYVVYRKDGSVNYGSDTGYVLVPESI